MANWNNPTLTSTYTNFVTEVKDRDIEAAVWFEGMSPTNLPTNAKRLNTSTGKFEKWNGTAWVDAVATFTFPALTVSGAASVGGALTISGGIANNPTLTAGTANGVTYLNGSKVLTSGSALTFDGTALAPDGTGRTLGTTALRWGAVYATSFADGTDQLVGSSGAQARFGYGPSWTSQAFAIGGSEQMRLTSTGLGIGTSSPAAKLTVSRGGSAGLVSNFTDGLAQGLALTTGTGYFGFYNPNYGAITFRDGGNTIENMRLTDSGNLGLGVTPSASTSNYRTLQIGGAASYGIFGQRLLGSAENFMGWNAYGGNNTTTVGTGFYYRNSGDGATMYSQTNFHSWWVAPSGTAGAAITFTQAMTLDASGNLGVGITSPNATGSVGTAIHINGATKSEVHLTNSTAGTGASDGANIALSDLDLYINNRENGFTAFFNNGSERARIDSSGNLIANASVTGYWQLPNGSTAQRPTGAAGQIRFNSTLTRYEGHNGSAWASIGGGATGGGSDDVFYENGQTVTTNYTISTNKNAMSAGPITIASGITVTVPSGSNWVVS